jgi:putative transcriptional regulator
MRISHHPGEELLLDYVAGSLAESWSLAVATHLALCPHCRRTVSELEAVGGQLMAAAQPVMVDDELFDSVMTALDASVEPEPEPTPPLADSFDPDPVLPQPLRGYLGNDVASLPWQRLGLGAYQLLIPTGDDGTTARLLRIPAGRPVPTHSHGGLELTLVLSGAFSDSTGTYGRGDLQEADENVEHQPHAVEGEDCICLAVTDAPLRFKSLAARMVQPMLGI